MRARRDKLPLPKRTFAEEKTIEVGGTSIEMRYFGAAHTPDNFVVWLPAQKVLFAGDLARTVGIGKCNVAEADQDEWPKTAQRVIDAYPDAGVVLPGHGKPGGMELLEYAVELFSASE